jgi:hypothetical protein
MFHFAYNVKLNLKEKFACYAHFLHKNLTMLYRKLEAKFSTESLMYTFHSLNFGNDILIFRFFRLVSAIQTIMIRILASIPGIYFALNFIVDAVSCYCRIEILKPLPQFRRIC